MIPVRSQWGRYNLPRPDDSTPHHRDFWLGVRWFGRASRSIWFFGSTMATGLADFQEDCLAKISGETQKRVYTKVESCHFCYPYPCPDSNSQFGSCWWKHIQNKPNWTEKNDNRQFSDQLCPVWKSKKKLSKFRWIQSQRKSNIRKWPQGSASAQLASTWPLTVKFFANLRRGLT